MPITDEDVIKQKAEEIMDLIAEINAISTDTAYELVTVLFSTLSERKFARVSEDQSVHLSGYWRDILLMSPTLSKRLADRSTDDLLNALEPVNTRPC